MQDSARGVARRAAAVPPVADPAASTAARVPGTNPMPALILVLCGSSPGGSAAQRAAACYCRHYMGEKPAGTVKRCAARGRVPDTRSVSHAACWQCVKPSSATTKATTKATPHRLCYCARGSTRAAPLLLLSSRSMCAGSTAGGPNLKPTASAPKRPRALGDQTRPQSARRLGCMNVTCAPFTRLRLFYRPTALRQPRPLRRGPPCRRCAATAQRPHQCTP